MQSSKYNSTIIFVISFTFYLLFSNLLTITDPVESNYALTAKEMVLSGDWISPQIYGQYWFDKPIFIYWVIASFFNLFGISELAARIGSALFSALGVALAYWFTAKVSNVKKGLVAAVILATSLQYIVLAKLIHTDSALFFFANAALVFFYLGYIRYKQTHNWYIMGYPCMALAVLTKGPVGVLLPAAIIAGFLLLQKNWREVKKMNLFLGSIIFSFLALPWYIVMYAKHGGAFIDTFFGIHNFLRATVSEHPRDNVFYYYPVLLILAMLPWSGLGLLSLYRGTFAAWRNQCVLSRFCLVWIVVYLLFYSLMATKYPTYVFPVLLPLVVLVSQHISFLPCEKKTVSIWVIAMFTLMLITFMFLLPSFLQGTWLYFTEIALVLIVLSVWYQLKHSDNTKIFIVVSCSTAITILILSATTFPNISEMRSGRALAAQIQPYHSENIGFYRYYSTSAVFYSGNILTEIVGEQEIEKYNPQANTWFRKYTMPIQTLQKFVQKPDAKRSVLIIEKSKWANFMEETKLVCSVKIVGEYSGFYIAEIVSIR